MLSQPILDVCWRHTRCEQEDGHVVLVQEALSGGDLYRFTYRHYGGKLPEQQVVGQVLLPLLTALKYLHSQVGGSRA